MDLETQAMTKIIEAFENLDDPARGRVLRWAADRFQLSVRATPQNNVVAANAQGASESGSFTDLAGLYDAANAQTQAEKALVVGYWIQAINGSEDWES